MTPLSETPIPPPSRDNIDKALVEYLKQLRDGMQEQIRFADQKAAYVFTFAVALMVSSQEGRRAFRLGSYSRDELPASLLSATMAIALVIAVTSAFFAVMPRKVGKPTAIFWGNWKTEKGRLEAAIAKGDNEFIRNEYMASVETLSTIANSKYVYVNAGLRALIIAVLAYLALLAIVI